MNTIKSFSIIIILFWFSHLISNAQVIFYDNFESGDYSKWKTHIDGKTSLVEVVETSARNGKYAAHFKTTGENGDRRSELVPLLERFKWYNEYWVGFSFKVTKPVGKAGIVYQNHSVPGNRDWACNADPNGFTIKAQNNHELIFLTSTIDSMVDKQSTGGGATRDCERHYADYKINEWQDIVIYFKYTPDSTGFIKVWHNGDQILDLKGINVYKIDKCGNPKEQEQYIKIGLYPAVKGADGEVYYDEFRVGDKNACYEEMKPER